MLDQIHTARPKSKSIFQYVCEKERNPPAEIIGGNQPAFTAGELIKKFEQYENLNLRIKNKTFHASLTLPKGEHLTDKQWEIAAKIYLKKIGFDVEMNPFTIIKHSETDHEHVHIVAGRIRLDGKHTRIAKWSYNRASAACREIEKLFNLKSDENKKTKSGENEKRKAAEKGLSKTEKEIIQNAIDEIIRANEFDLQTENGRKFFENELAKKGVGVKFTIQNGGTKLTGMSFVLKNVEKPIAYSGTKLGTDYKTNNLCRRANRLDEKHEKKRKETKSHWENMRINNSLYWAVVNATRKETTFAAEMLKIYFTLCAIESARKARESKEPTIKRDFEKLLEC